jgi:hypothetical protein
MLKSSSTIYLTEKLGYNLDKSHLIYLTLGGELKNYEIKYNNFSKKYNNKLSYIFGIGHEYSLNKNFGIFTEINHSILGKEIKTEVGSLKSSNTEARIYL